MAKNVKVKENPLGGLMVNWDLGKLTTRRDQKQMVVNVIWLNPQTKQKEGYCVTFNATTDGNLELRMPREQWSDVAPLKKF